MLSSGWRQVGVVRALACFAGFTCALACKDDDTPHPTLATLDASPDAATVADALFDVEFEDAASDVPPVREDEPPPLTIGLDAIRLWHRWPYLRIGARTYMRSTYDRSGGNEAADASHFLRQDAPDHNVTLDVVGNGVLSFVRTNHWHGSPWHYIVDGADHVVTETSTADPDHPISGSTFEPKALFPAPLALTWSTTKGADLNWVPMEFAHSFTLAYGRTFYGTGYYIYTLLPFGEHALTRPFRPWDGTMAPDAALLSLVSHAGEDLAPTGDRVLTTRGSVDVPASGSVTLLEATDAPAMVRALKLSVDRGLEETLGHARLRITWDDRPQPSVDAPIALFFGTGTTFNRTGREYLVKALPFSIHFDSREVTFATYFPMPYFRKARIELISSGEAVTGVRFEVRTEPYRGGSRHVGYFHGTYVDHGVPTPGKDLVLLDTRSHEGGGGDAEWCGHFVGTSFVFSDRGALGTLEGDPRFFFDDSLSPQGQGTGTEEWGGGGDYWGGETMTLPFAGHPVGASAEKAVNADDKINSAYRVLLGDAMPFGRNARIQLEHGGVDDSVEHYRSVTYWYGLPGSCLRLTDALQLGDLLDEAKHHFVDSLTSPPETLVSRWEWGVDHFGPAEVQKETTDVGRHTTGTSELTLTIDPENFGVLLRRRLDYGFPDQRADVFVADASEGAPADAPFAPAGTWFLAGSNRCLYMFPAAETGTATPRVETSNRRFREDEHLIPRRLTRGRSAIRVRIVFRPVDRAIAPGEAKVPLAWSAFRYSAYVETLPPSP